MQKLDLKFSIKELVGYITHTDGSKYKNDYEKLSSAMEFRFKSHGIYIVKYGEKWYIYTCRRNKEKIYNFKLNKWENGYRPKDDKYYCCDLFYALDVVYEMTKNGNP